MLVFVLKVVPLGSDTIYSAAAHHVAVIDYICRNHKSPMLGLPLSNPIHHLPLQYTRSFGINGSTAA